MRVKAESLAADSRTRNLDSRRILGGLTWAFADFTGNFVESKDYQVLTSTHDFGQAEFLRRKFKARGLSCAVFNLLGQGKAGVEWEFVPPRGTGLEAATSA